LNRFFTFIFIICFLPVLAQESFYDPNSYSTSKDDLFIDTKGLFNILKTPDHEILGIFVLSTDCPISQKYIKKIKTLSSTYDDRVSFYFFLTKNTTNSEKVNFEKDYEIDFKLKIDKKNKLLKLIGASVTPEAFLICRDSGKILFHGAIDNWFYSLGKKRSVITANYFEDALKQLLNNEKIRVPFAQPVGCYIE